MSPDHLISTGLTFTTIGKLFRNAERNETGIIILGNRKGITLFFRGKYTCASRDINPDCFMPSFTRNKTIMVRTPVLENPAIISLEEIIPVAKKITAALNRIIPGRNIPARKAIRI